MVASTKDVSIQPFSVSSKRSTRQVSRMVYHHCLLFLIVILSTNGQSVVSSDHFGTNLQLGAQIRPTFSCWETLQTRSLIQCAILCERNATCASMVYVAGSRDCMLYTQTISSAIEAEQDNDALYLERIVPDTPLSPPVSIVFYLYSTRVHSWPVHNSFSGGVHRAIC